MSKLLNHMEDGYHPGADAESFRKERGGPWAESPGKFCGTTAIFRSGNALFLIGLENAHFCGDKKSLVHGRKILIQQAFCWGFRSDAIISVEQLQGLFNPQ